MNFSNRSLPIQLLFNKEASEKNLSVRCLFHCFTCQHSSAHWYLRSFCVEEIVRAALGALLSRLTSPLSTPKAPKVLLILSYTHNNINYKIGRLCRSWYEQVYFFLPSILGDTSRDTQIIRAYADHTMLTHHRTRAAQFVASNILTHLCRSIPNICLCLPPDRTWYKVNLLVDTRSDLIRSEKLYSLLRRSYLNSRLFQNPKILWTIYSGYDVTLPLRPHFLSRSLLWQLMIVISYPCGRVSAPSDYDTWTKKHCVVQSLRRLNKKI